MGVVSGYKTEFRVMEQKEIKTNGNIMTNLYKLAGIEKAQNGIGVSTSCRVYARRYYASQGNMIWATARNDKINDLLAQDFVSAEARHRFKLKSGEVAEIRKSATFIYVAVIRGGTYDIIVLQKAYREPRHPEISKRRLESPEWGGRR